MTMAQRKIKSEHYLNFIHSKGRSVTGRRGVIDAHHESIYPGFRGDRKSYNDYGALPLEHEEHIEGRHGKGMAWWKEVGLDPKEEALKLLTEYYDTLSPFKFSTEEEYDFEIERVEEHIGILREILVH